MPPPRASCQICATKESKYACSKCTILYCSLPCYKQHKESPCADRQSSPKPEAVAVLKSKATSINTVDEEIVPEPPLRPLTSLNWPYVPEQSSYPDPLKRDDPKMIQLHQYEAIATSPTVRAILSKHPNLKNVLLSIDKLRGSDREEALQRALGVSLPCAATTVKGPVVDLEQDNMQALRRLAEAIESAVRGNWEGALGLDWDD